jgi:hypothetical protein
LADAMSSLAVLRLELLVAPNSPLRLKLARSMVGVWIEMALSIRYDCDGLGCANARWCLVGCCIVLCFLDRIVSGELAPSSSRRASIGVLATLFTCQPLRSSFLLYTPQD